MMDDDQPVVAVVAPSRAMAMPGTGRRSGLSLSLICKLAGLLAGGNYIITACQFAGVSERGYHRHRLRGETEIDRIESMDPDIDVQELIGDTNDPARRAYLWDHRPAVFLESEWPSVFFVTIMARAKSEAEIRAVNNIMVAAQNGDWKASLAFLERTAPARWGRRDHLTVTAESPLAAQRIITIDDSMDTLRAWQKQLDEEG